MPKGVKEWDEGVDVTARMFGLPAAVVFGFLNLYRCQRVKSEDKGGRYRSYSSKIRSVTFPHL